MLLSLGQTKPDIATVDGGCWGRFSMDACAEKHELINMQYRSKKVKNKCGTVLLWYSAVQSKYISGALKTASAIQCSVVRSIVQN